MKELWVSVDVEPDIAPPHSYVGVVEGVPRLLKVLASASVLADFFVAGEVAARFPNLVQQIAEAGHTLGSHGYHHELLCLKRAREQHAEIRDSVEAIFQAAGQSISMFRAPNFSANGTTIRILEELGLTCDSSVLPGRVFRRWGLLPLYDHRLAPRGPYKPSRSDIDSPGKSSIWELPCIENPLQPGTPIGLGFLNSHTISETIGAAEMTSGDYVTFLVHPWEAVDLHARERGLPRWLEAACSPNLDALAQFLSAAKERWESTSASDIMSGLGSR